MMDIGNPVIIGGYGKFKVKEVAYWENFLYSEEDLMIRLTGSLLSDDIILISLVDLLLLIFAFTVSS